jgi:hypothetical protein
MLVIVLLPELRFRSQFAGVMPSPKQELCQSAIVAENRRFCSLPRGGVAFPSCEELGNHPNIQQWSATPT